MAGDNIKAYWKLGPGQSLPKPYPPITNQHKVRARWCADAGEWQIQAIPYMHVAELWSGRLKVVSIGGVLQSNSV